MRSSKIRNALVVMQIAGCLMLLAAAALAARTLQRTQALDLGFSVDGVVRVTVDVERHHYTRAAASELYRRLIARASALPAVRDVALTTHVPLTDAVRRTTAGVEGLDAHAATDCTYTGVTPGYFRTLSIPIVAGRGFTAEEAAANARSANASRRLSRQRRSRLSAWLATQMTS